MSEYYIENVLATGRIDELVGNVEIGDNVKLVLRINSPFNGIDAERLWFKVVQIYDDLTMTVELDNDPTYLDTIKGIDRLTVNRYNVLELLKSGESVGN